MPMNRFEGNNIDVPAIEGGPKAVTEPYGMGNKYGAEELTELEQALVQGTLFYAHGHKVKEFCRAAEKLFGRKYCIAVSSGTAAVHTALFALGVGPGDEIITSPITDMGSLIGILWQNAVPVFADIDLRTGNCTAGSIEAVVTLRTKAILLVHLAGYPCDMGAILALASRKGLPIIEDCAQSYMAEYRGKVVGTFTELAAWSMNDFKHISAGEAGFILTDDERLAHDAASFADKYYQRDPDVRIPAKLGMNYRISELQGAVALAQLRKLPWIVDTRRKLGEALLEGLRSMPGLHPLEAPEGGRASYLGFFVRVDEKVVGISARRFAEALQAEGVRCSFGHTGIPVYEYPVFRDQAFFPGHTGLAFESDPPQRYMPGLCPNAEEWLRTVVGLEMSEFYTMRNIGEILGAFRKLCNWYIK